MQLKKIIYYPFLWLFFGMTDAATGQDIKTPPGRGLWTVDISHDDKFIALGGDDSLLRIFTNDLALYRLIKIGKRGMIRAVHWHPKETLLAISTRNSIWILDPLTGKEIELEGHHNGSRAVAWNYNGEMLAAAAGSGIIWIWNKHGQLIRSIQKTDPGGEPDNKDFLGMDWHPSGDIITTVGDEVRMFDTSGRQLFAFRHRQQHAGLLTVKWHPSGEFFVTGDYGHPREGIPTLLQFWQPDGKLIKEWNGSRYEFRNIQWNKQGTRLATASDALRIWTREGKLLYTGKQNGDPALWGMDWLSDSKKIVTVNFNPGTIQLWDNKAKLLKTIN